MERYAKCHVWGRAVLITSMDHALPRSQVHQMYLRTWFPVDFISSIPLEVLLQYAFGLDSSGGEARSPKLLRSFIRLVLKSARMTRMMKSFRLLEYVEEVSPPACLYARLLCVCLYARRAPMHYLISHTNTFRESPSWV